MKPIVYIASPYTKGDPAINVSFQLQMFDELLSDGLVWPTAPLWSHFQHIAHPRPYSDWVAYDNAMIERYDACLRLNVQVGGYFQSQSSGADAEVALFRTLGKPVFYDKAALYAWVATID